MRVVMAQLPRRTPPGEIGEASEAMVFLFLAPNNQMRDALGCLGMLLGPNFGDG